MDEGGPPAKFMTETTRIGRPGWIAFSRVPRRFCCSIDVSLSGRATDITDPNRRVKFKRRADGARSTFQAVPASSDPYPNSRSTSAPCWRLVSSAKLKMISAISGASAIDGASRTDSGCPVSRSSETGTERKNGTAITSVAPRFARRSTARPIEIFVGKPNATSTGFCLSTLAATFLT